MDAVKEGFKIDSRLEFEDADANPLNDLVARIPVDKIRFTPETPSEDRESPDVTLITPSSIRSPNPSNSDGMETDSDNSDDSDDDDEVEAPPVRQFVQMAKPVLGLSPKIEEKEEEEEALLVATKSEVAIPQEREVDFLAGIFTKLEEEQMPNFVRRFDRRGDDALSILRDMHPGAEISLVQAGSGVSAPRIVKIDGKPRYILKKTCLHKNGRRELINKDPETFSDGTPRAIANAVREHCVDNPRNILDQDYPYMNMIQREKMAAIMGGEIGVFVPKTELLECSDGSTYSLHDFVENEGTVKSLIGEGKELNIDIQSFQDMVIGDILGENQDRSFDNMLVKTINGKHVLIPIDHALMMQQSNFQSAMESRAYKGNRSWHQWDIKNEFLTAESIRKIQAMDANKIIHALEAGGLVVDNKMRSSIIRNCKYLKDAISSGPITAAALFEGFMRL